MYATLTTTIQRRPGAAKSWGGLQCRTSAQRFAGTNYCGAETYISDQTETSSSRIRAANDSTRCVGENI
jgi:hypothetical protein